MTQDEWRLLTIASRVSEEVIEHVMREHRSAFRPWTPGPPIVHPPPTIRQRMRYRWWRFTDRLHRFEPFRRVVRAWDALCGREY
jgi:hypothetical protein